MSRRTCAVPRVEVTESSFISLTLYLYTTYQHKGVGPCYFPPEQTNKQKNRPEARTDARDKAREQDERRKTTHERGDTDPQTEGQE